MMYTKHLMRAAVVTENHEIVTQNYPVPTLGPEDLLLKVHACGVCGTDIGKVKYKLTSSPIVLGHEVAGEIVKKGDHADRFQVGDRVVVAHHTPCYTCHYCRRGSFSMCKLFKSSNLEPGGFSEFLRIPSLHARLTTHLIPPHMGYEDAIFMEPLACVLRNIKRLQLQAGDTVLVIGMGTMGLLTAQSLMAQNIHVLGSDLREDRRALAQTLGISVVSGDQESVMKSSHGLTQNRGVDAVVLTSGNERVYSQSLAYVRDGGTISVFAGMEAGKMLQIEVNELYKREITLMASYSPSPTELVEALEYLSQKKVRTDILSPKRYPLEQLESAIVDVGAQKIFKAIIAPSLDPAEF